MKLHEVSEVWQLVLVYEIRKSASVIGQNIPIELEFDENYGENYNYVLLEDNKKGVSTARLNLSNKEYAKIERVATAKEYQFKGYGSELIKFAEKIVKEKGFKKIVLTSQEKAKEFYEKLGYKVNESIKVESKFIPVVWMEKEI